ncbi:MAG: hypothetical protein ACE5KK_03010 [Candidatus Brocadiales bacterium]
MTKLTKYCLIPALVVMSIAAIAVNAYFRLIKKPTRGEAVNIEILLPQPEKKR